MARSTLFLMLVFSSLLFAAGCVERDAPVKYESNVGASCNTHSECKLPMDYAIQSNCPFGTACIEGKCKVICALYYHDLNPEVSKSHPVKCEADSNCDCSQRIPRTIKCTCLEGNCVSVEAE